MRAFLKQLRPRAGAARRPRWAGIALAFFTLALACEGPAVAAEPAGLSSKPLAPHPHPQGKTMFVQLTPDETGVHTSNAYSDPRMRGDLYEEFETSSIGTGIAIGDYDGDGLPDIFVVSKTEGCRLFRNLGNYRFEDVTEKAGVGGQPGVWTQGATFVDINNSGRLDLYVCRYNAPNLLYINQGDGTFKEMAHAYGLDIVDSSVMAAFCDYDRDGWLDLYLATNILSITQHPNGQRGYLFHNNRNGTFTDVTAKSGISGEAQSHSATWWDFNNDGWPDLYVANDYGVPDKLYRNNGDGTFTDVLDRFAPHTSFSSMGADLGDVNNDGLVDLFVADMQATTHQKDQHSVADARARTEEVTEVDRAPKYHRNALLLNTDTGRFLEAANLAGIAATDWTWSARLEDFDNDGWLDLFVTNGFPRDPGADTVARMQRAETPADRIRIIYESQPIADIHFALRNRGHLEFEDVSQKWGLGAKGISFGTATGDLSRDGNLDIVYANYNEGITLLRNDNDTGHRIEVDLQGTVSNRYGVGSTVRVESALGTQVRPLVLARGYMSSSEPMLHFGLGGDTVVRRMTVTWPSGHVQTFDNLAVDRRYSVTEPADAIPLPPTPARPPAQFTEADAASGLRVASHEEAVDETYLQKLLPFRLNARGPAVAVGGIFGDDTEDVVIGGTTVDPLRVLRQVSPGRYLPVEGLSIATGSPIDDGPLLLFDAAGTGHPDLLVTKGGNALPAGSPEYQPRLYLNDGQGGFHPAPADVLPPYLASAGAAAAADFDHSGRLGVFIGGRVLTGQYPEAPPSLLLANRGGRFEDVTDTLAPGLRSVGMVTSALWSDVDGDGWPDLLLTLDWGTVRYFHNQAGKGFEDWTEKAGFAAAGRGWWTSIASADFNGDGRPDFVVGNVGLNTHYHAEPARPALLYAVRFKEGEAAQLIEGYYEGDRLYPWRSRRDLGAAVPNLLRRYPTFDAYGHATLEDLVGAARLKRADRYEVTELRSGVFLSRPDGTYAFEPLPRIAQIAPADGMVAGDFDGLGHAGIYVVQNSYAPIPAVGRFDGGLSQLLRGDGHGHFQAAPLRETGLVVPHDAKGLVALDLAGDGRAGFLVTRNNDTALAFINQGAAGGHPLRIALRGPPGNPTGVGSRICVAYADGSTETQEVFAGSGFYSQSSPACWFGYSEVNPAKSVRVRWPTGAVTEQAVPPGSSRLTLAPAPR